MSRLVYNAIRTPDGTVLKSSNEHRYRTYTDDNEETYIVDGGLDYLNRSINNTPAEELSRYESGSQEQAGKGFNVLKELEAEMALSKELYEAWCRAETRALVEAVSCVENQDELLDDIRILEASIKEIRNES